MAKTPFDKLTSLSEDMLGKASQNPTANRLMQAAMQMKERVDDLSKRVRGLEQMEKRLIELETRVTKLDGGGTTKKPPASKKPATTAKETAQAPDA